LWFCTQNLLKISLKTQKFKTLMWQEMTRILGFNQIFCWYSRNLLICSRLEAINMFYQIFDNLHCVFCKRKEKHKFGIQMSEILSFLGNWIRFYENNTNLTIAISLSDCDFLLHNLNKVWHITHVKKAKMTNCVQ
jgi:hypothetical protein